MENHKSQVPNHQPDMNIMRIYILYIYIYIYIYIVLHSISETIWGTNNVWILNKKSSWYVNSVLAATILWGQPALHVSTGHLWFLCGGAWKTPPSFKGRLRRGNQDSLRRTSSSTNDGFDRKLYLVFNCNENSYLNDCILTGEQISNHQLYREYSIFWGGGTHKSGRNIIPLRWIHYVLGGWYTLTAMIISNFTQSLNFGKMQMFFHIFHYTVNMSSIETII